MTDLNTTVGMSREEIAARTRAHSTRAFTFMYTEGADGATIHRADYTDSGIQNNVCFCYDFKT